MSPTYRDTTEPPSGGSPEPARPRPEPTPRHPYRPGVFFRAWTWLLWWTFMAMLLTGAVVGIGILLYAVEH